MTPARARLAAHSAAWNSRSERVPTTHTWPSAEEASPAAIVSGTSADGRSAPTPVGSSMFFSVSPMYRYPGSGPAATHEVNHRTASATASTPSSAYG